MSIIIPSIAASYLLEVAMIISNCMIQTFPYRLCIDKKVLIYCKLMHRSFISKPADFTEPLLCLCFLSFQQKL